MMLILLQNRLTLIEELKKLHLEAQDQKKEKDFDVISPWLSYDCQN